MGLDITAYSHLRHLGKHTDDWCENEDHIKTYAYADFPRSFRGIPVLATTVEPRYSFLEGGCYETTDQSEILGFGAGSYGGYNRWRDHLREQFNPETDPDGPFYELIWFADNEGSIGPEAAADLLADFDTCRASYVPFPPFRDQDPFEDWGRAFKLASQDGLIRFH